jgi:hypothetical protein
MLKFSKKTMKLFQKDHDSVQLSSLPRQFKSKMHSCKLPPSQTCTSEKDKPAVIQTMMISLLLTRCYDKTSTRSTTISTRTSISIMKLTLYLKSSEVIRCQHSSLFRQKLKSKTVLTVRCKIRRVSKTNLPILKK